MDNGQHIIFVNTKVNDGTKIAELMQCFEQPYVDNPNFPHLFHRMQQFKNNKEAQEDMCELVEEYANEKRKEDAIDLAKMLFDATHTFEQVRKYVKEELLTDTELLAIEKEVRGIVA